MKNNFYQERNIKNIEKIESLLLDLPPFCSEYFIGIENQTSTLTRLNYAYDLRIFFDYLSRFIFKDITLQSFSYRELECVDSSTIERFLSYLNHYQYDGHYHACNERAKARKLSSVRAMFKYFFNKEKIAVNHASKIALPKLHDKEIVRLESYEISELLNCTDSGYGMTKKQQDFHKRTKLRDIAIMTLFLGTGIRISELVGLNNTDINFTNNSFKVTRKGGNEAILYFSDEVAQALKNYLESKKNNPEIPKEEQALFLSLQMQRISIRAVENLVKKYSKMITPLKKISPHKLRSTFGTQLYRETQDIYAVADVLGHRDVNTTKKHYAAITEDIRKSVANKVVLRKDRDF